MREASSTGGCACADRILRAPCLSSLRQVAAHHRRDSDESRLGPAEYTFALLAQVTVCRLKALRHQYRLKPSSQVSRGEHVLASFLATKPKSLNLGLQRTAYIGREGNANQGLRAKPLNAIPH